MRLTGMDALTTRTTPAEGTMTSDLVDARQEGALHAEVIVVLGTRSEAVALVPVVRALRRSGHFSPLVVSTGQQRVVLDQVLRPLGVRPDVDLALAHPEPDGPGGRLGADAVEQLGELLAARRPDAVLVQGDSATAFGAALAACSEGIRVGHLGAGLRSRRGGGGPLPEEANQRLIAPLACWHLAPTGTEAANLVAEGIDAAAVTVTGTTAADTVRWAASLHRGTSLLDGEERSGRVLACVRLAEGERRAVDAVGSLAAHGLDVVLPLHPDDAHREIPDVLRDAGVRLVPSLDYLDFVATMRDATFVVTDSGAIEQEASALGKPVLVVGEGSHCLDGTASRGPARGGWVAPGGLVPGASVPGGLVPGADGAAALRVLGVLRRALLRAPAEPGSQRLAPRTA